MTTVVSHRPARGSLAPLVAALLAGGLATLAGCKTQDVSAVEPAGAVPADYRINHPIAVTDGVESIDVPVGIYSDALTDAYRQNVNGFAQKFLVSGSSLIAVVAPSGSPNQNQAAAIAVQIEDVLRLSGIAAAKIDYRVYHAGSTEQNAPIRIAYSAITAQTAPCGPWSDQLSVTKENTPYFAFGCATQQNLAAVVDNPLDLLYPRGLSPADATRRANVLEKYRAGQAFSADLSKETGGNVAQGVGQ